MKAFAAISVDILDPSTNFGDVAKIYNNIIRKKDIPAKKLGVMSNLKGNGHPIGEWKTIVDREKIRLSLAKNNPTDSKKDTRRKIEIILNGNPNSQAIQNSTYEFYKWYTEEYDSAIKSAEEARDKEKEKICNINESENRVVAHLKEQKGMKLERNEFLDMTWKYKDKYDKLASGKELELAGLAKDLKLETCQNKGTNDEIKVCILDYINTLKGNGPPPPAPEPQPQTPAAPDPKQAEEIQKLKGQLKILDKKNKKNAKSNKSLINNIRKLQNSAKESKDYTKLVKERLQKIKDAKDIECTTPGVDDTTCILDFIENLDTTAPPPSSSTTTTTPTTAATPPPTVTVTPSRPQPNLRALKNVMVWDTASLLNMAGRKVEVTPTWSRPYI